MAKLFLTIPEFCDAVSISRTGFYHLVRAGELHVTHIGRSVRISASEVERWASELEASQRDHAS